MAQRRTTSRAVIVFLLASKMGTAAFMGGAAAGQDRGVKIWREFVSLLKSGGFTADRIEPMDESFRPFYFLLYNQAAHLKQQIGFDDYRELFETIWQDRARAAGWTLKIEYKDIGGGLECVFHFHRRPDQGVPAAWPSPAGLVQ